MTTANFGYNSSRATDDIIPAVAPDWSGVGMCSTSDDADPAVFPPNEPVRFQSTDKTFLAKLGTGELAAAVTGLNAQLEGYGADLTVVRVPEGTGADAAAKLDGTFANIIGTAGAMTGLYALRNALHQPGGGAQHLIAVPGYTWQQPDGLAVDNPVRSVLHEHLAAMRAIAAVDVDSSSLAKSVAARDLMSSERMLPVGVTARVYENRNGVATLVNRPMSSRVLGRFVATDNANGGRPFETIANQPIYGIAGINRPISFDLGDGSTEAQKLLAADVGVVVRGESANVAAIADGGFIFIGVESAGNSDLWSQIHQVRAADYIDAKMMRITRQFLGPMITPRRAEAWLRSMHDMLKDHVRRVEILGYELEFPREINSINEVRQGHLQINTKIEPGPAFRRVTNTIRRYPAGVQALIDAIVARAGVASAVVS